VLALALVITGGVILFRVAVGVLKDEVTHALGPKSEIAKIPVGWSGLDVEGVRIHGAEWPSAETFRADRITLVPSLLGAFSGRFRVHSIRVVRPYLSVLRTKDGQLKVVPSLLSGAGGRDQPEDSSLPHARTRAVTIDLITLRDGVLELFDAAVTQPPLKIQLQQVQATAVDVVAPALTGGRGSPAVVKALQHDGTLTIAGWAEIQALWIATPTSSRGRPRAS
jgi:uncharacterized protein involved in outer membrane biogenesis